MIKDLEFRDNRDRPERSKQYAKMKLTWNSSKNEIYSRK